MRKIYLLALLTSLMAREPIAGMMDKNVPSQLDMEDLAAEVELELPGSMDDNVVAFEGVAEGMDIEMTPDEDGGVTIDFDITQTINSDRTW